MALAADRSGAVWIKEVEISSPGKSSWSCHVLYNSSLPGSTMLALYFCCRSTSVVFFAGYPCAAFLTHFAIYKSHLLFWSQQRLTKELGLISGSKDVPLGLDWLWKVGNAGSKMLLFPQSRHFLHELGDFSCWSCEGSSVGSWDILCWKSSLKSSSSNISTANPTTNPCT